MANFSHTETAELQRGFCKRSGTAAFSGRLRNIHQGELTAVRLDSPVDRREAQLTSSAATSNRIHALHLPAQFFPLLAMNLIADNFPPHWLWGLWLLVALLGLLIARRARWRMLGDATNLNIFLAATVAVLGLWLIKTGIKPGLNFHLIGATALTLMFRPLFALFSIGLITAAISLWQGEYAAFSVNWLIMGVVPVAVSWGIYTLTDRKLPNHLFIYIFLNAFFGSALAIIAVGLASTIFVALSGAYPVNYLLENYLPFFLLISFSEAFITGMLITMMVIYKPEWVATFDDKRYLLDK